MNNGAGFGDLSRKFTTNEVRLDSKVITLQEGQNYTSPLIIQVMLRVTDTGSPTDVTIVRTFKTLDLVSDDLNFNLTANGRSQLVRGDHGVPINFNFENTLDSGEDLTNIQVLNLLNLDAGGASVPGTVPVSPPFGAGPYELCTFTGGVTTIGALPFGSTQSGQCTFDFLTNVPINNGIVTFQALILGTENTTNRPVFGLGTFQFEVIPHLEVEKFGFSNGLPSDPVEFTVRITNNSGFQYVDFDANTGISELVTPDPGGTSVCIVTGAASAPLCPTTVPSLEIEHFTTVVDQGGGIYRLAASPSPNVPSVATVTYEVEPGGTGWIDDVLSNNVTAQGRREYDPTQTGEPGEALVSASDSAQVGIACPIQWTMNYAPAGAAFNSTDSIFTLGEEVRVTITAVNIGGVDINFSELLDLRYQQDQDPSTDSTDFLNNVANWPTGTPGLLPAATGGNPVPLPVTWTYNIRLDVPDFQVGPIVDRELTWALAYMTDLGVGLPACSNSVPNDARTFSIPIVYPIRATKVASPQVALNPGQIITYSIDMWSVTEAVDMQVDFSDESLFGDLLIYDFPGDSNGIGAGIGSTGRFPPYDPTLGPDIRPALGTLNASTFPDYTFDPADINPPGSEELINQVSDQSQAVAGPTAPFWVDIGVPMTAFTQEDVLVVNPLVVTETVVLPTDGVVSRPGQILYYVTVRNTSDQYSITNISLSNIYAHPQAAFVYPVCNVTPGYNVPPIDLTATPDACLETMPFSLPPGESDAVVVTVDIPGNYTDPDVVTQSIADAVIIVEGVPYNVQSSSQPNQVLVETPALTLVHDVYADSTCSTLLVDVVTPDRDKNNDGIPELEVGGAFFYGVDLFVAGNRIYNSVQYSINMMNGDPSLGQAVQNELLAIAIGGANPNVTTPDNASVTMTDNGTADPEVSLCVPQPNGYTIASSQPDPLFIQANIAGLEQVSGEATLYITNQDPSDDIEDDAVIDVTDPNIFISKSAIPNTAFPGETVLYTISITNLTQNDIFINDVYDDNVGVGQQFYDHDSNPNTPPIPLEFHNGTTTSIDFFKHVDTSADGLGWDWEEITPGVYNFGILPANGQVTYTYERIISDVDPNPLVNRAGVIGYIDNPAPNPDTPVQDETINTVIVSNSQLNVVKTATPTSTVLGSTITYTINITNIGDDAIYDLIVWDDRYNLQHALDGSPPIELLPTTPPDVLVFGTEFFTSIPGANDSRADIGGQLDPPNISKTITLQYTLPVPPACLTWTGAPNEPYNMTTMSTPGNTSSSCADSTFDNPIDLPLIDPFINTAYAVGLKDIDPDPGVIDLEYLEDVGFDRATVDIINPDLTVRKTPNVTSASIGSDVEYTIELFNTGDDDLVIEAVIDVPNANIPIGNTDTVQLPITSLTFGTCVAGSTTLTGTQLIPSTQGGSTANNPIVVGNTAILPIGCSASALIIVQVPNPLPNNEYINVVQVDGENRRTGEDVSDITSARIDIAVSGLEISKRAWNCDTASNGGNTPNTELPDAPGFQCTQVTSGPFQPGAMQLALQDEGRDVYFELSLLNSGDDDLTSIQITDVMMINQGAGLVPNSTRVANGTEYEDSNGEIYTWQNGQLILGVPNYAGFGNGTCAPSPGGTHTDYDNTYNCEPGYRGYNLGPFGEDNVTTTDRDESYLFAPGEEFQRPDPGPVDIPVITYPYTVNLNDDLDGDDFYINRARVVGTPFDPLAADISNLDIHLLEIRPATINLSLQACVENDGNTNYFDPDLGNPCVTVARPGQSVWYRIIVESNSFVPLSNLMVNGTQIGTVPNGPSPGIPIPVPEEVQCWYTGEPGAGVTEPDFTGISAGWPGGTDGRLPTFGSTAVCTFHRNIPLQVNQDPFINTVTVEFDIESGLVFNPGTPVVDSVVTRIAANELLVTVPGCETGVIAMSGDALAFDVEILNIDPVNPITNLSVVIPEPPGTLNPADLNANDPAVDDLTEGSLQVLTNALQIQVPQLGPPSIDYIVLATGTGASGIINSSFTCTVQRVDGALAVTKTVVNLNGGGTVAQPGDTVRYTITIENLDPFLTISSLVISDPLIETEIGAAWDAAWPQAPNDFILPGQVLINTFDIVATGVPDPLLNTVTASGLAGGITPVLGSDIAQVDISSSDIVVTSNGFPNPVIAGNNATFTYQVCNINQDTPPVVYEFIEVDDDDPGAPLLPGMPTGVTINAQECQNFQRIVPTTLADVGTTITRTAFAQACPVGPPGNYSAGNCPPAAIASDSQSASVNVVGQPSDTAIIDLRLTANVIGVAPNTWVNYTTTITNLNTLYSADVSLPGSSLLGIFDPTTSTLHNITIPPLGTRTETQSFLFLGAPPDPLIESIDVDYVMGSGAFGTETATLSLPVATIAGAELLLAIDTVESQGTPGGPLSYRYTITNIGSTPVFDAYLFDQQFIPVLTPDGQQSVTCNPATPSDTWGIGHSAAAGPPVTNFVPVLFPNGFSRTATLICNVDPTFQLSTPPISLINLAWANLDSLDPQPANDLQDQASYAIEIVPPLDITMEQVGAAVPGGPVTIQFNVENIGPNPVNGAVLTAAVPPECVGNGLDIPCPAWRRHAVGYQRRDRRGGCHCDGNGNLYDSAKLPDPRGRQRYDLRLPGSYRA